ncbi:MAG: PAS domain-containing protein, partial [Balneolaceae bacterium]|nr:PAS domain-containing protein [Balneolaceae bacterium]
METLRRKNRDYSKIFDKASEFTYRVRVSDGEPEVEYVSEAFPEMTGLSFETLKKEGLKALVHKDDYGRVVEHYKKAMQGNKCTCEYRIRGKEGGYIEVVDYAKPDWDEKQKEVVCAEGAVSLKKTPQTA